MIASCVSTPGGSRDALSVSRPLGLERARLVPAFASWLRGQATASAGHRRAAAAFLPLPGAGKRCFTLGVSGVSSRSYVPTFAKTRDAKKERPSGPTNAQQSARSVVQSSKSGAEGAAFLDTEVSTQRVETRDRLNSTAKRLRLLTKRSEWLEQIRQLTGVVREQRARKLEARGRALALDRRRVWRDSGLAERQERNGRPVADSEAGAEPQRIGAARLVQSRALAAACQRAADREHESPEERDEREQREAQAVPRPPAITHWHSSRAKTQRELFERVEMCGTDEATRITLVCRGCGEKTAVDVGCGSRWFCPKCRVQHVNKFRGDFSRKRLGLLTTAARAGLTRRRQARGNRWGERMLTLTLPHVGTALDRIRILEATWSRFFRLLRDRLRPHLQEPSGILVDDLPRASSPSGVSQARVEKGGHELTLWEVFTYLRVLEWTPGDDGDGHPHYHVWLFSRYLDQKMLHKLWERAYYDVRRAALPIGPIQHVPLILPDIRECKGDPGAELIKYLTKDWELNVSGARRASPAVYSHVYAELDGRRLRQSSSRFADWGVDKLRACPCCWHEGANGWARVDITHALEHVNEPIGVELEPADTTPAPLAGASRTVELRNEFERKRDAEWAASVELRVLRARVRAALNVPEKKPRGEQLTFGEKA